MKKERKKEKLFAFAKCGKRRFATCKKQALVLFDKRASAAVKALAELLLFFVVLGSSPMQGSVCGGETRHAAARRHVKRPGREFWIGFGEDWRMLTGGIARPRCYTDTHLGEGEDERDGLTREKKSSCEHEDAIGEKKSSESISDQLFARPSKRRLTMACGTLAACRMRPSRGKSKRE